MQALTVSLVITPEDAAAAPRVSRRASQSRTTIIVDQATSPTFALAANLRLCHDRCIEAGKSGPFPALDPLWRAIERNHRHNMLLWNEEDQARRRDVHDSEIAKNKRAIDHFNQERNNAIEEIDETLLTMLAAVEHRPHARLNSETPGSMIDRLSILSLKCHHMRLQTQRIAAGPSHVETCLAKLAVLSEQRSTLETCLDELLEDASRGLAYFKIYRQFKMYNDPALNPSLYAR
jgi:hypothetical protein